MTGLVSPLVGRDAELATLLGLGEAVRAGLGRAALIVGEPGMGKTRLLAEWQSADQATAASPPLRWARGACLSDSRGLAYHLLLSLLRSLIGVPAAADEAETRAALSVLVQDLSAPGESEGSDFGQDRGAPVYALFGAPALAQAGRPGAGTDTAT